MPKLVPSQTSDAIATEQHPVQLCSIPLAALEVFPEKDSRGKKSSCQKPASKPLTYEMHRLEANGLQETGKNVFVF